MARIKAPVVVTANRLGRGEVVYFVEGRSLAGLDGCRPGVYRARRGRGCAGAS